MNIISDNQLISNINKLSTRWFNNKREQIK